MFSQHWDKLLNQAVAPCQSLNGPTLFSGRSTPEINSICHSILRTNLRCRVGAGKREVLVSCSNNHKSPLKCCHVTCHTAPLMTRPIFHRVFLSVCPDTRLLESSSRFTSSAPRPGLSTSSSHIYKYQPAKWHFLSPTPCLASTGSSVTWHTDSQSYATKHLGA